MARPREFEIEDALQDAMNVFWEKGYDGASMPDLLTGMGIARGELRELGSQGKITAVDCCYSKNKTVPNGKLNSFKQECSG